MSSTRRAACWAGCPTSAAGHGWSPTSSPRAGTFYITEVHPIAQVFENEGVAAGELRLAYPYWEHHDPLVFDVKGSYADPDADVGAQKEHGWGHGLGEIVTALVEAGLRIESLEEHPYLDWGADFLVEMAPGSDRFQLPPGTPGELPLMFSLRASKPIALTARTLRMSNDPRAGHVARPAGRSEGRI